jgi:hypothetical protein
MRRVVIKFDTAAARFFELGGESELKDREVVGDKKLLKL